MKKVILLLSLFLFLSAETFGQTNVSGALSSDTTWSLSNSPYTVTGNVLVLDEVTLTIEAGVVIKLQNNVGIVVNGTLIANGNETNRIIFTSDIAKLISL